MHRAMKTMALLTVLAAASWAAADKIVIYDDTYVTLGETGEGEYSAGTAYLGVDTRDITPERMAALKLKEERGVEITMVDQDAPAGKAGLKEHDVILQLNGQSIEGVEQLHRIIRETPPGRTVTLTISRDGQPMTLKATLADRRKAMAFDHRMWNDMHVPPVPPTPPVAMPSMPVIEIPAFDVNMRTYSSTGVVIESLTPQLGEYFGVKNGEGVLVRSVEKGSPADKAGMKAGDIIIRVDKSRIADRNDWRSAMRGQRGGKVTFGIIRERREQNVILTLPERKTPDNSFRIEIPDVDFESLSREIDRMRPEIEKASFEAAKLTQAEIQRAMRQARIEMEREMKKARKDMEQMQKEMDKELKESAKELPRDTD